MSRPPVAAEFQRQRLIRFSDCDPAGIVFYPQYFVMFNGLIEDWVNEGLGLSYHDLIARQRVGLPTVHLEVDFRAVTRMGEQVTLALAVDRLGSRSIALTQTCLGPEGDVRLQMQQVLVTTSLETHRAIEIPVELRRAITSRYASACASSTASTSIPASASTSTATSASASVSESTGRTEVH
jgi:4-hydroxybenzoyl-CoA thioesterase